MPLIGPGPGATIGAGVRAGGGVKGGGGGYGGNKPGGGRPSRQASIGGEGGGRPSTSGMLKLGRGKAPMNVFERASRGLPLEPWEEEQLSAEQLALYRSLRAESIYGTGA